MDWTTYLNRIQVEGINRRDRETNRYKNIILNKSTENPACKKVNYKGNQIWLTINDGKKDYLKEFCTLPNQFIYTGDYIEWLNNYWLVYEADDDNEIYVNGKMQECNYLLKWQNSSGEIIERWVITQNAVQYNNGESGNKTITLGSDQLMIYIPFDSETIKLRRGKRFFISNDLEEPIVYKLTRPDSTTYVRNGHGYLCVMVTEDLTNSSVDRPDLWLCDYIKPVPSTLPPDGTQNLLHMKIPCSNYNIRPTGRDRVFIAHLYNSEGIEITTDIEYIWTVTSNISSYITYSAIANVLSISLSKTYQGLGEEITITCSSKFTGQADTIKLKVQEVF